MNTTASAHPVTETPSKPGFVRRFISLLGTIAEKGKRIFSVTALVVVLIWSLFELQGWRLNAVMDKVVPGFIIVLMIFELWKTTATHQLNKKAFILDLVTGVLEFTVFWVVVTILLKERRLDYSQLTNWMMLIFVTCDAIFVPYNRFVMVFRQITSVTDQSASDEHKRHQADHAGDHHHHGHGDPVN